MSTSSTESEVESVIALALSVADGCRGQRDFSSGATAANAVVTTLRDFQIHEETYSVRVVTLGPTDLTYHLTKCSQSLRKMLEIQQRKGQKAGSSVARIIVKSPKDKFERETMVLNDALHGLRETVQALRKNAVRHVPRTEQENMHAGSHQQETTPGQDTVGQETPRHETPQQDTERRQADQQSAASIPGSVQSPVPVFNITIVNSPEYRQQPQSQGSNPAVYRLPTTHSPAPQQPQQTFPSAAGSKAMCRGGSGCRAQLCHLKFDHPNAPKCPLGRNCSTAGCSNWHPKSSWCPNGPSCNWRMNNCEKAHPWPLQEASRSVSSSEPESQGSLSEPSSQDSTFFQGGAPSLISSFSSMSVEDDNPRWCQFRFNCPDGYNGGCPYRHPRRAPCRDGSACRKGTACTFDHSAQVQAQPQPQEVPANPRRAPFRTRGPYSAGRGGMARGATRAPAELQG
ncbi:hypothetical protein QBC44DRAFT_128944 [Cladorrhinum sp. PSN332]|nr:hypothetical protein QBC44DRAFT_128944 [Cladorrhinum sp. PSN332]